MAPLKYDFERVKVDVLDQVATVFLQWPDGLKKKTKKFHRELPEALALLRNDDSVRVVILRGPGDRYFLSPMAGTEDGAGALDSRDTENRVLTPDNILRGMSENRQVYEAILGMPKPVIAMVNGDALGIGASLAMACDIIIAVEDVHITDCHIANHYWASQADVHSGAVPGDGGCVFWPMDMSIHLAKEYLFTGRPVTARELAERHVINRAVPREELQAAVDEMVDLLLQRPAWALAWTKQVLNKQLKNQMELTLDASSAFQVITARLRQDGERTKGTTQL